MTENALNIFPASLPSRNNSVHDLLCVYAVRVWSSFEESLSPVSGVTDMSQNSSWAERLKLHQIPNCWRPDVSATDEWSTKLMSAWVYMNKALEFIQPEDKSFISQCWPLKYLRNSNIHWWPFCSKVYKPKHAEGLSQYRDLILVWFKARQHGGDKVKQYVIGILPKFPDWLIALESQTFWVLQVFWNVMFTYANVASYN